MDTFELSPRFGNATREGEELAVDGAAFESEVGSRCGQWLRGTIASWRMHCAYLRLPLIPSGSDYAICGFALELSRRVFQARLQLAEPLAGQAWLLSDGVTKCISI